MSLSSWRSLLAALHAQMPSGMGWADRQPAGPPEVLADSAHLCVSIGIPPIVIVIGRRSLVADPRRLAAVAL
jgi:hypothetical protein